MSRGPPLATLLAGSPTVGVYYGSWTDNGTSAASTNNLYSISQAFNMIFISFANPLSTYASGFNHFYNPDSSDKTTTGLEFQNGSPTASPDGFEIIKQCIAHLRSNGAVVMLSVGGASYTWNGFTSANATSLVELATDMGCNGIDIDYEEDSILSGANLAAAIQQLRDAAGTRMNISLSGMSTGAFGQPGTPWANTFNGSKYQSISWEALQTYGQALNLDWIEIQSYDAGPQIPYYGPTNPNPVYDTGSAFDAYRSLFGGPLIVGFEIPDEAWGGNILNSEQISEGLNTALYDNFNNGNGVFVWFYNKTPSAGNQFMTTTNILTQVISEIAVFGTGEPAPWPPTKGPETNPPTEPPTTSGVPCFVKGTQILTTDGYKNIEDLDSEVDTLVTSDDRVVSFKRYDFIVRNANSNNAPYLIPSGFISDNCPSLNLKLSPMHALKDARGIWQIPECLAKMNSKVVQVDIGRNVHYYHIECPNYMTDHIFANGTVVESFNNGVSNITPSYYVWNIEMAGFQRSVDV